MPSISFMAAMSPSKCAVTIIHGHCRVTLTLEIDLWRSAEGFLAPGQDVKLEVSFHPTEVNSDIRVEHLPCQLYTSSTAVDGGSSSASAGSGSAAVDSCTRPGLGSDLLLTLTGACVDSEAVGEPVVFRCNVRTSASKAIQLRNTSSTNWQLRPVIQNEFWSGAEFLQVSTCSSPIGSRVLG